MDCQPLYCLKHKVDDWQGQQVLAEDFTLTEPVHD